LQQQTQWNNILGASSRNSVRRPAMLLMHDIRLVILLELTVTFEHEGNN
jgi:hypothetical protein